MKTSIKILGMFLTFILFGCRKPIKEFQINTNNKKEIVKFYSDSTFTLESEGYNYSGNWNGRLKEEDTVSITSTMNGYSVLTSTPKESFKIING